MFDDLAYIEKIIWIIEHVKLCCSVLLEKNDMAIPLCTCNSLFLSFLAAIKLFNMYAIDTHCERDIFRIISPIDFKFDL